MTTITRKATIDGLLAMGWTPCPWHSATKRYQVFGKIGKGYKMLIGKSGALRKMPDDSTIAKSISFTGRKYHAAICTVGSDGYRFNSVDEACEVYRRILEMELPPVAG